MRTIFVNTIESSLGKNHEIIKELPIPKKIVSPWMNDLKNIQYLNIKNGKYRYSSFNN